MYPLMIWDLVHDFLPKWMVFIHFAFMVVKCSLHKKAIKELRFLLVLLTEITMKLELLIKSGYFIVFNLLEKSDQQLPEPEKSFHYFNW